MGMGGGGSSSGEISYPDYMENKHEAWLDAVAEAMTTARSGASPYSGFVTADPTAVFGSITLQPYATLSDLQGFDLLARYEAFFAANAAHDIEVPGAMSDEDIATIVAAEVDRLEDARDTKILPAFQAGMRDINAVVSSAFVLGKAIIDAEIVRDGAQLDAKLRIQNGNLALEAARTKVQQNQGNQESARQLASAEFESMRLITVLTAEIARIYTAARLDVDKTTVEFAAKDRLFDLETFQYGSNVMAGISGGTAHVSPQGSTASNAIGGALSGAAAGAMLAGASGGAVGGPAGMAIGAGLGLLSAFLQ